MNFFQLKVFDIFNIFAQNIDCGYTLEPPLRGGSNEYPQCMFGSKTVLLCKSGGCTSRTCYSDVKKCMYHQWNYYTILG